MTVLNKTHDYKGNNFNIKVELDYKVERRIDGKREHKIVVNDMGPSNYYQTHFAETHNLKEIIDLMIEDAEKWVDKQLDELKSPAQRLLEDLGFK